MDWSRLVGRKVLLKIGIERFSNHLTEATVIEISPSGEHVKLRLPNGNEVWKATVECKLVEELW